MIPLVPLQRVEVLLGRSISRAETAGGSVHPWSIVDQVFGELDVSAKE